MGRVAVARKSDGEEPPHAHLASSVTVVPGFGSQGETDPETDIGDALKPRLRPSSRPKIKLSVNSWSRRSNSDRLHFGRAAIEWRTSLCATTPIGGVHGGSGFSAPAPV